MATKINLLGQNFNRLTVESYAHSKKSVYWNCTCKCGNTVVVRGASLRSGGTGSCGCLKIEHTRHLLTLNKTHGEGNKTTEYNTWIEIKRRCTDKNRDTYKHYGGRGVKMCDEWMRSYEMFLADMGRKPTPQHSIDRIDVDGDYCKENCRWATRSEQSNNRRINIKVKHKETGIIYNSIADAARNVGIKERTVRYQLDNNLKCEFIKIQNK